MLSVALRRYYVEHSYLCIFYLFVIYLVPLLVTFLSLYVERVSDVGYVERCVTYVCYSPRFGK
jgi:hypothetical protein